MTPIKTYKGWVKIIIIIIALNNSANTLYLNLLQTTKEIDTSWVLKAICSDYINKNAMPSSFIGHLMFTIICIICSKKRKATNLKAYLSRVALASLSSDFLSCVSNPSMKLPLPS